jgi:hypothetical protein
MTEKLSKGEIIEELGNRIKSAIACYAMTHHEVYDLLSDDKLILTLHAEGEELKGNVKFENGIKEGKLDES